MTKKHQLKTILPLAAVAMFASASVSNAAPVVYDLTVDGESLGGTITFDSAVAPTSTDGGTGNKIFTHPTGALPAFSFTRDGSTEAFDQTDDVFELFLITDASFTPLFLKIDIDDNPTGQFIFVEGDGLDLTAGTGQYQPGAIDVTGAALTVATTPAADPAITSITSVGGDDWELKLEGENNTAYEFESSTTLVFPGTKVENLMPGVPAVGGISGDNSEVLTTNGDGEGTVRMMLTGPNNFVRAQIPPPVTVFEEDFEDESTLPLLGWDTDANNPADTATTTWDLGTPSSVGPVPPGVPLPSGSNCVGTNIGADYGIDTDIWLRTPEINLGAATAATLSFQHWTEIEVADPDFDYGSIMILKSSDNSVLATLENQSIDGATTGWEEYSMELPAEVFNETGDTLIKVEWRFEADDIDSFPGWYIDDVAVTVP